MRIIFIHQNMPGQYKHLAPRLAAAGHEVVFITRRKDINLPGVRRLSYDTAREERREGHGYTHHLDGQLLYGQAVAEVLCTLKNSQFIPDVICAHSGWGEAIFIKDVFPDTPTQIFSEFFYRGKGSDIGFENPDAISIDRICRSRLRNTHMALSMIDADALISPTVWQWQQHPKIMRDRMSVVHDGVDTQICTPNPKVAFQLPTGKILSRDDEVITYMARNLEPYRGFHKFMEGLGELQRRRPEAHVVIVGGDDISYGSKPRDADTWRQSMLASHKIDTSRTHFLGRLPYDDYIKFLQVSRVHVYLTYPFVLSWSSMEAMAVGCAMAASSTPPVREAMRDDENALLFDFHKPMELVDTVCRLLDDAPLRDRLGQAARQSIIENYDLETVCIPRQMALIEQLAKGQDLSPNYVPTEFIDASTDG
ncbi:MAG: glycosyl transferase family 1 [Candidatus Endolissoclinum sp. TMED26]|nr:MAG: glycosyl transferase family 1 [Candidatus Endolissoclinum sp. TMED26]